MKAIVKIWTQLKPAVKIACIVVVLALFSIVAVRLISGRGLGLGAKARSAANLARMAFEHPSPTSYSHGDGTNVIFLHHSTGGNLIEQGGVREGLTTAGYDFWDHGYNAQGLRRPDGSYTSYNYNVPSDNTDPDGLAAIFAQRTYGFALNAFSGLLQHEVIAFKSCFPVSNITSDEQLEEYKSYYQAIRDAMAQHPDKVFIVITPPPLNPVSTNAEAAARARAFADWLKSDEYLSGHPNVFTFDFFDYLAEDDPTTPDYNMLRAKYQEGSDSHPNQTANETIGPVFVDFTLDAVQRYRTVYEP